MFRAQNAAANIFIGVSIGTHDPGHSDRLWRRRPKEIVISRLLRSLQNSRRVLSVGRRTAGVDHAKLRELLLVTSRTCNLLRFVNERIIANALIQFQISTHTSASRTSPLMSSKSFLDRSRAANRSFPAKAAVLPTTTRSVIVGGRLDRRSADSR